MPQLPISYIVNVQISRETQTVTQAGFGVILILGVNGNFGGERVRQYSDIDGVLEDFNSSAAEYLAALRVFSQNPNVGLVKIGVEGSRVIQTETLVFSANIITGNTITVIVNATTITQAFDTSNATTLTALATQISAVVGIGTASSDGSHTITIPADHAGISFLVASAEVTGGVSQATATITTTIANHGIAEDLEEISNEDDDWYGLIWTERASHYVKYAMDTVQSLAKIYGTCSNDDHILDDTQTDDIAYYNKAHNYTRSFVIYNADPTDFADAGLMSVCFTLDPGTENWAFKGIIGIVADQLTQNEVANAIDPNTGKNANVYINRGGVDHTEFGNMGQGYIDETRYIDLVTARIKENIFGMLLSEPKVPFNQGGFVAIESQIRQVLQKGEDDGAIDKDPKYTIRTPSALNATVSDRGHRIARDFKFNFRYSGAVNQVYVNGTVAI